MSLTVIDRFHPRRRTVLQAAVDAGRLRQIDEMALLEPEQMLPLARFSLQLLVVGGIFFIVLNLGAFIWRTGQHGASLNFGLVALWFGLNILGYILVLPFHEFLHGTTIFVLGGRPHYGAKLPFALYCGAKNQIFSCNGYTIIALAPCVLISLAGIVLTLLVPTLAPYFLFALVGNVSGAAGDIWMAQRLHLLPAASLVEDLETGYRAWEVLPLAEHVRIENA
ncbi:MAG TPA: DUF3267 domain-containing protein [Ktedonobacteraceae bacterium]